MHALTIAPLIFTTLNKQDMGRESIEDGLPTRPLLLDTTTGGAASGDCHSPADASPITPFLVLSTFVAVCASFCYGCAVGYSSPAESGIMEDLGLSVAAYSVFGSILTIGGMVGAILSGKIADLIGRRRVEFSAPVFLVPLHRTMWVSQAFCTPGWLAIAFAEDVLWLDIGRLLIGLGVGIGTYVVPVYIAEITPKNLRGQFASANQLMISCGFALAFFLGNIVSWRTLSLIASIPCMVQLIGLFFIPESPRWLAKLDREKEFEAALRGLRGENADISQEAADIKEITESLQTEPGAGTSKLLFQRRYTYPITVGVGLMLLQQLGGTSGLAYYANSIFSDANFSTVLATTVIAAGQIPTAILCTLLMDTFGRRPLLLLSSAGTFFSLPLVALSFYLQEHNLLNQFTPILAFVGYMGYCLAFCIGLSGIPWIIMSEIFPINVKATAGSLVNLTNWSCSWLVTFTFNFLMEWSPTGTFLFFTVMCGLTVLFIWKLVPETKGRSLEEIQATMAHIPW